MVAKYAFKIQNFLVDSNGAPFDFQNLKMLNIWNLKRKIHYPLKLQKRCYKNNISRRPITYSLCLAFSRSTSLAHNRVPLQSLKIDNTKSIFR